MHRHIRRLVAVAAIALTGVITFPPAALADVFVVEKGTLNVCEIVDSAHDVIVLVEAC